ncbi:MAG: AMP-binding protein, partial [Pseudomonadota bacterium]
MAPPVHSDLRDTKKWTVGAVMLRQSRERPTKEFLQIDGRVISYLRAYNIGCQVANFFAEFDVNNDDFVAVMLPNSMAFCECWFGVSLLGAVHVAVNTDYSGRFLEHVLNNSRARFMVIDAAYVDRLEAIASRLPHLERVFVVGDLPDQCRFPVSRFEFWKRADTAPQEFLPDYKDTACVMYTSGTTG